MYRQFGYRQQLQFYEQWVQKQYYLTFDMTMHDQGSNCSSLLILLVLNIFTYVNCNNHWYLLLTMGVTIRNLYVWGFLNCIVVGKQTVFAQPGSVPLTHIKVLYGPWRTRASLRP